MPGSVFSRRSRNGESAFFSSASAAGEASAPERLSKSFTKSPREPSRPAFRNSSTLQRSSALFSNGVPVSATLSVHGKERAARETRVSGFLIVCASSSTSAPKPTPANALKSFTKSGYPVTTTSQSAAARANEPPCWRSLPCWSSTFSLGAKRPSSRTQFIVTLTGATISTRSAAVSRRLSIQAIVCMVFPSPMSSARRAPKPLSARNLIHE